MMDSVPLTPCNAEERDFETDESQYLLQREGSEIKYKRKSLCQVMCG